jgi:predicted nucleic acid-binding protein
MMAGTEPMNREAVFIDTWGWMALGYHREPRHAEVRHIYRELLGNQIPIFTNDYVLDELITLLFRREIFEEAARFVEGILAAAARDQVQIERVTSDRFAAAWALRMRFQDKPMISFTDLVSMVIMEERGIQHVLTQDKHFAQVGMGFFLLP